MGRSILHRLRSYSHCYESNYWILLNRGVLLLLLLLGKLHSLLLLMLLLLVLLLLSQLL